MKKKNSRILIWDKIVSAGSWGRLEEQFGYEIDVS